MDFVVRVVASPSNGILAAARSLGLLVIGGENDLGCPAKTGAGGQTRVKDLVGPRCIGSSIGSAL